MYFKQGIYICKKAGKGTGAALSCFFAVSGEASRFLFPFLPNRLSRRGSEMTGLPVAGAAFRPQGAPRVNRNKRQRTAAPIEVAEGGPKSPLPVADEGR